MPHAVPDPDHAWLVKVNLVELARNLSTFLGRKYDAIDAALWLTRAKDLPECDRLPCDGKNAVHEPSPFRPTDLSRVFYSEADPRHLLEAEEIVWTRATRLRSTRGKRAGQVKLDKCEGKAGGE